MNFPAITFGPHFLLKRSGFSDIPAINVFIATVLAEDERNIADLNKDVSI